MKIEKLVLGNAITSLFNMIFASGYFPQEWRVGLIYQYTRKAINLTSKITLLPALNKLFTSVLNHRLYDYLARNNIVEKEQLGFRKKYSTIDGIFMLKGIVDKVVKCRHNKSKPNLLFSCFVDFKKAFDCIPRQLFFAKIE